MEKIKITNEKGEEKEFDVLFEFTSANDNKKYIVYTDYTKEENTIKCYSSIYEEGILLPITNEEELEFIDSMLESIEEQAKIKYKLEEN